MSISKLRGVQKLTPNILSVFFFFIIISDILIVRTDRVFIQNSSSVSKCVSSSTRATQYYELWISRKILSCIIYINILLLISKNKIHSRTHTNIWEEIHRLRNFSRKILFVSNFVFDTFEKCWNVINDGLASQHYAKICAVSFFIIDSFGFNWQLLNWADPIKFELIHCWRHFDRILLTFY